MRIRRHRAPVVAVLVVAAAVATACSRGGGGSQAAPVADSTPAVTVAPTVSPSASATVPSSAGAAPAEQEPPATGSGTLLVDVPEARDDASFPPGVDPEYPVGAYGFSRYVWTAGPAGVLPTLVEGPRGEQFRCQDADLPCSYGELTALRDGGDAIPPELGMTPEELDELVGQLDVVAGAVASMPTADDVCAAGYVRTSSQNPNMGIHMVNSALIADGFDPAHPEILLLAKEGAEARDQDELGACIEGVWFGEPGFTVVGAAFMLPMTPDHPDAFAGPIDNWHIHYNTCTGANNESGSVGNPDICAAEGGEFAEVIPVWMIHAYVHPDHESQEGVFAMFNGSIWPLSDGDTLERDLTVDQLDGATLTTIVDFDLGVIRAEAGEEIVFSNADSVPHTVTGVDTAGPGAFDTGVLGGGQLYATIFDTPGEYAVYCALHPQMTGTVIVE